MTETKAIALVIGHLNGLFPKTCRNCARYFGTLRDFYAEAQPVGQPVSYDLELGDLNPLHPIGTVTLSNCPCGTTLALTSEGMPLLRLWSLLHWAHRETRRRGMTQQEFLQYVRLEIRQKVLSESTLPAS